MPEFGFVKKLSICFEMISILILLAIHFVQVENHNQLTNEKLYKIAKEIPQHALFRLGLNLGLSTVEIKQIEDERDRYTVILLIFKVLCKWRDKRLYGDRRTDIVHELRWVLTEEKFDKALELLDEFMKPTTDN